MKFSEKYFRELVDGKQKRVRDRLLLTVLRGCSAVYGSLLCARAAGYRAGLLRSFRLPVPVISIGNITLGGTGKTPAVAWLAEELMKRGKRVAVLSRGYGGSAEGSTRVVSDGRTIFLSAEEAGDEPCLLARKLPGLMVVIGPDRYRAGRLALEQLKPDLFILDDGFQHLRLKRDLDILLLDAGRPFSNGCTLPAGFLRERRTACQRADLVVYTRCAADSQPDLFPGKRSLWSRHSLRGMVPVEGGELTGFESLQGARITAFSGIADPAAFFDLLEAAGVRLTATLSFPDHTRYDQEEIAAICRLKDASRSTILLTTEKDAVKLVPHAARLGRCYAAVLELAFTDSGALDAVLEKLPQ